jgi:hypothetical protein
MATEGSGVHLREGYALYSLMKSRDKRDVGDCERMYLSTHSGLIYC